MVLLLLARVAMLGFSRFLAGVVLLASLLLIVESSRTNNARQVGSLWKMTNAQRLARGLSPNKPQLRRSRMSLNAFLGTIYTKLKLNL